MLVWLQHGWACLQQLGGFLGGGRLAARDKRQEGLETDDTQPLRAGRVLLSSLRGAVTC